MMRVIPSQGIRVHGILLLGVILAWMDPGWWREWTMPDEARAVRTAWMEQLKEDGVPVQERGTSLWLGTYHSIEQRHARDLRTLLRYGLSDEAAVRIHNAVKDGWFVGRVPSNGPMHASITFYEPLDGVDETLAYIYQSETGFITRVEFEDGVAKLGELRMVAIF